MANVNIKVGYTIDKTGLNEIKKQLEEIQKLSKQPNLSNDLKKQFDEASKAASQLKNILNSAWNSKLGQLDLSKVNNDIRTTYGTVQNLQKALVQSGSAGTAAYNNFARSVLNTNLQLKQTSKFLDNMAVTLKNTIRYGISSSVFNNFTNSVKKAYDYTIKLDTSLNDIRIVTGKSADEMDRFAIKANKVAKDLGRSTKDFTEASLIYYQQGLDDREAVARAEVTMKAANVTGQTGRDVSEQLTAVWNGYKVTAEEAELYVDKLAAVAAGTAADLEELSTGMSKVASAANLMGVDIDQLNAQLATIVSVTRQAPESVGVALKTIYARMSDIKSGLSDETTLGNYTEKMAQYGVNVLDANNNLRDMGDVIEEIGGKWTSMSREQQVALAQTMAGTRQYNNLLSLFDNWDMYTKSLEMSANAAGTLQEQQDIYMESTAAHLQQLSTEAERTYDILFNQDTVNGFTDALTGTLSIFNDLLAGLGGGTRDFLFFGNLVAGIFNKQIGASIERQIENVEAMRANIDALNFKGNVADSIIGQQIIGQHNLQGESIGSAGLEKEAEIAKQLLQVRQSLSSEQYNELTNLQSEVGLTEDKIVALTKEKTKSSEILDIENATTKDFQERLLLEQEELKIKEQATKTLKSELRFYKNTAGEDLTDEDTEYLFNTVQALKDRAKETKEANILEEASLKISEKKALTEAEIQTILEAQNNLVQNQQGFVQQVQSGLDNSALLDKLKEEQFIREKLIQQQIEQAERQKIISDAIRGMAGIVSTLTAVSGIVSTLTDKEIEPWDKFKRVMTTIVATAPAMIMAFKGIQAIIPALTIGMRTLATAIGVTGITATTSFGEATVAVLTFETALGPLWLVLLAITAAVAAVGFAVYQYQKEQNAANEALKDAQEYAKQVKEEFEDTKKAYDDLKASLEDYKGSLEALDKLTKGTREWKEAIIEINSKVLDLMDKYPQLVQMGAISTNSNGMLQISDEGWDRILDDQFNKVSQMQGVRIASQITVEEKALAVKIKDLRDTLDNSIVKNLKDGDIKKLAQGVEENSAALENSETSLKDFKDGIEQLGISLEGYDDEEIKKLKDSIVDNRSSIGNFNTSMDSYTTKVGEYTTELVKALNQGNDDYINSEHQTFIDKETSKKYDEARERAIKDLEGADFADIASIYMAYFGSEKYQDYYKSSRWDEWNKNKFQIQNDEGNWIDVDYEKARNKIIDQYTNEYLQDATEDVIDNLNRDIKLANAYYNNYWGMVRTDNEDGYTLTPTRKTDVGDYIADVLSLSEEELLNKYSKEDIDLYKAIITKGNDVLTKDNVLDSYFKNFDLNKALNITEGLDEKAIDAITLQMQHRIAYGNEKGNIVNRSAQNLYTGIQSGDITAENIKESDDFKLLKNQLEEIKKLYPEVTSAANTLEETWLVGSQEYLEALGLIQDKLYETKSMALNDKANTLREDVQKTLDNMGEVSIATALNDEKFKEQLDAYLDAEYQIDVNIHAEAENEFNDIVNAMDDITEKASLIGENFIVSANDVRELNNTFPGIIQNMRDLGNGTVQLNEEVVNSAIGMAQAEVAADSQATIKKLQNQSTLLRQKQAVYQDMANAALILAQGETESDQTAAEAKAKISEDLTKIKGINDELQTQQEMDNDKAAADASYSNGQITAKNWASAYQSAAQSSYKFATVAVANNKAAAGNGNPVAPGDFGVNYSGSTGSSSEAKILEGTQSTLDNATASTNQWAALAQKYQMLADSSGKAANDIEGMIAQIGASNVEIANKLGNIRQGNGTGKNKSGGGSSKEADYMEGLEDEKDIYHDVNIILEQISTELDKLEKQKKKLFGQDLIENLNKQLNYLNNQIDATNQKIFIAQGEAAGLRTQLAAAGVSFNSDGTISNYAQAYNSQLNYVNSLIAKYDSMSAEAQKSFKNTVEQAKKDFDTFTKNIDRYDEIITDMIPGLEADIQDAIDEKIDLQIEKFDMEIEIRLDLAEAERDWNDFKKRIIDGIEDDDILGNAMARLVDFSSYYKEDNTGIVQALRKQVDNTLAELNAMDTNGWSQVYGDNRTAALDDLKKYYEELMSNLTDVLELQKEIHESYIDMMDEAQEKFDEQIEAYEMISDLIEHDMEVISLVYGEQSYGQLAKYYDKQQQNFNSQLDFQRQQADFWRQQLDTLEEGSDEWENAREKWKDAVQSMNDLIEKSIQNLQDKYLNAINLIFQNLNNKITDNLGLEYIEEEWNLINKNADQYLDTINSLYEVQKLEGKYLDALDQTDSISAQRQLKKIMDEELADLRERDKLTQYDIERANKKYEIALKQIALQEAQQNKSKMRLRRDSQGNYRYEYTVDGDQIGQLQDELNDMYNSLYNFDKARYQDNLNQMYDVWVEFQEKMAEAAQINDPVARSERELLLQSQYEQLINGLTEQNTTVRNNLHESAFDDLSRLYDIDVANFQNMSDEEKDVLMGDLLPYWESGVQHMTDVFAGEGGFLGVCKDAFDQLHDATKDYEDGLDELENTGRIDFESIGEGIDENINRTQQLISDNTELINSYEQELTAIGNVIAQLDDLVNKYNAAKDAAIAATKAAYEYWSEQQRQAAVAAGNANGGSGSGNGNSSSGSGSSGSGAGGGSALGGDNNLVVGETATYSGKYYYDSYGSSPTGSKYSGVANGIVVDRITNNPYGIHIHSADGRYRDLGWVKKSQLSGYDTGGYTGEWGSDGRLALLHQKELVLNKEDTANMLNAISIMRNITNMLGSSVLGKLAAATAGGLGTEVGGDVLEQNVHIDAQFPNVKDSREIEEALNNLVNMASMRANRR